MTDPRIARWRLHTQRLSAPAATPADVVRTLAAVQSQDYKASLWAVGLRTRDGTEADVERALAERAIVRTHFMRNTVHLVPAADLRWMMRLVAPRIRMVIDSISRTAGLDLDERVYARSNAVIARALAGGRRLTRPVLAGLLEDAGIRTEGRLTLIAQRAQTDGVVCHGLRRGAQHELALVDEWLPPGRELDADAGLAELARRYFRGHGPATVRDFAWWTGLTLTRAREALEMVRAELSAEGGLWYAEPAPEHHRPTAHLLPNYDELTVGYRDRDAVFDPVDRPLVPAPQHNVLFVHTIAVDGRIVGTWRRPARRADGPVELRPFRALDPESAGMVEAAVARYRAYLRPSTLDGQGPLGTS